MSVNEHTRVWCGKKQLDLACRDGRVSVNEHKRPIQGREWRGRRGGGCKPADRESCSDANAQPKQKQPDWFDRCCYSMAAAASGGATVDRVALFHYATKSWQDFEVKMARGSGMGDQDKDSSYFDDIKRCASLATRCFCCRPLFVLGDVSYFDDIKRCASLATRCFCYRPLFVLGDSSYFDDIKRCAPRALAPRGFVAGCFFVGRRQPL